MTNKTKAAVFFALAGLTLFGATRLWAMCGQPMPYGNIILVVPAGGGVTSQSGDHDCAAGTTCDFEVPGTAFSDTFTASPAEGYKFVRWKNSGTSSLCRDQVDPCVVNLGSAWTAVNPTRYLEPVFAEIGLLDLLPAATRGVFQIYPGEPGALDASSIGVPWGLGPLQLVDKYSAGIDVAANAYRLVLGQLSQPGDFLLLAELESTDVPTVSAGAGLTNPRTHQGFTLWNIGTTNLDLAQIDDVTLAIGAGTALELALDAYTGAVDRIDRGPLAAYLGALQQGAAGFPNSFVYGLPALYGAVPAPGNGDASLSQAKAVNSLFGVTNGILSGALNFFTDNAASYRATYVEKTSGFPQLNTVAHTVAGNNILSVLLNNLPDSDMLPMLKTLFLDMDAVDYTNAVVHGGNVPWMNFQVSGDPPAIFISFEFDPAQVAAFEAAHLPPGFAMVPFRMIEGDPLRYMMVLNIYQGGGGLVAGARAEWSVFVNDPDTGEPRFLVVQAKAENFSADSVSPGFLVPGQPVSYLLDEAAGALVAYVGEKVPGSNPPVINDYFTASIPWPQPLSTHVPFAREFMPANDYVFWGNAVADKVLYNSTAANRDAAVVPGGQFTLADDSVWAAYLAPSPLYTAVYLNNQEIVISPWWNLDEDYLDVTPELRTALVNFKNNFYPGQVQNIARDAIRGQALALNASTVADSVPTAHYHFPLADAAGLLAEVAGAPGIYTPAAVDVFADESADYYLTLAVYKREGDPCGVRTEWMTYVQGSDGRPETLVLDALSANGCLDPVALMTPAAAVSQDVDGASLHTQIDSPFIRFDATVDLSLTDGVLAGLDWLEATERSCSLNGICNEFYYDGQLVLVEARRAGLATTTVATLETPWDNYIDAAAGRAGIRQNPTLSVFNPWRTMRSFAGSAPAP